MRFYEYVGPDEIKARVVADGPGAEVRSHSDLEQWLSSTGEQDVVTCTFVIDLRGVLRIADRHSEHVACAGGAPVQSAGEMTFARHRGGWEVDAVTNQSTGYCPEPESWSAVAAALEAAELEHPYGWTDELVFRRYESCGERNVVKDGWFVCDVCDSKLPSEWNFASAMKEDEI